MCLRAYVESECPDQPAYSRGLIRAFAVRLQIHLSLVTVECVNGEQRRGLDFLYARYESEYVHFAPDRRHPFD